MTDLFNFYSVIPKSKNTNLKGFKQHYIEPNSRILMIGGSGTGKSNHGLFTTYKPEQIERFYHYSTSLPLGFLTIDLKTHDESKRLRSGFTSFFKLIFLRANGHYQSHIIL